MANMDWKDFDLGEMPGNSIEAINKFVKMKVIEFELYLREIESAGNFETINFIKQLQNLASIFTYQTLEEELDRYFPRGDSWNALYENLTDHPFLKDIFIFNHLLQDHLRNGRTTRSSEFVHLLVWLSEHFEFAPSELEFAFDVSGRFQNLNELHSSQKMKTIPSEGRRFDLLSNPLVGRIKSFVGNFQREG